MKNYEMVWEVFNPCQGNRGRDVSIEEIESDDLDAFVRSRCKGESIEIDKTVMDDGVISFDIVTTGVKQHATFKEI